MAKYKRKKPVIIDAVQVTDDTYDGYSEVCAYHLDSLIFVDERLIEEKYKGSIGGCRCEYEDDGYCMKAHGERCEHMRKIGYIAFPHYQWYYPLIGDYMIKEEGKPPIFMTAEEFEKIYEPA
jgi:hypothetical protein